jgi:hypothetical protein
MKKILVLTGKAFHEDLDSLCIILEKKYKDQYSIRTIESMSEGEIFDYAYIVISKMTSKDELNTLIKQASLWTDNNTNIVIIQFETIIQSEEKIKRRQEKKLNRKLNMPKKTSKFTVNFICSILEDVN